MTKFTTCLLCAVLGLVALCGTAMAHPPNGKGLDTPSPDIPPIIVPGVYLSPADVHAKYSGPGLQVVLSLVEHQPFALLGPTIFTCDPAGGGRCGEHHHFDSDLHAMVSINGSLPQPIEMQGDVRTVAFDKNTQIGTFDTEMLQMNLVGPGGVMIRESPTKASTGKTSIESKGSGFHIDSFFDVFTELTMPNLVDPQGNQIWIPSDAGVRVYLGGVPEPASFVLLALGLLSACGFARRR